MILRPRSLSRVQWRSCRRLMTLAIETSCDDTSVAIVEKGVQQGQAVARLHFHKKVTSDNSAFQGIHPLVSLQAHQENLADLVKEAIDHLPRNARGYANEQDPASSVPVSTRRLPDLISVTRGPGMRSNLCTGLDTAKGLAVAWQKPLIGVHHMQAHALTPRLVSALEAGSCPSDYTPPGEPAEDDIVSCSPNYPFLSVLASGGHTLLIHSASLADHQVLGSTNDIAIGEYLDKVARVILPREILGTTKSTMYGSLLEDFAFGETWQEDARVQAQLAQGKSTPLQSSTLSTPERTPPSDGDHASAETYYEMNRHRYRWYKVATNHEDAMQRSATKWGWGFDQPLSRSSGGKKINSLEMSFSGLMTAAERVVRYGIDPVTKKLNKTERAASDISLEERKDLAREAMRAAFEHVASRVVLGLLSLRDISTAQPAVVMAGGVAANSFLRQILASTLCFHGYPDVHLYFPPPKFCTDNAAMIAWTGLEMFEAGHTDPLSIRAIRKWPLDRLLDPPIDG